jgi:hypothetical protein
VIKILVAVFVLCIFWGLAIYMLVNEFEPLIIIYAFFVGPYAAFFLAESVPTPVAADGWKCKVCGSVHKNNSTSCFVCGVTRHR